MTIRRILIHATHEAGVKFGGIGAVLDGLLSAQSYLEQVDRSLCVGAFHADNPVEMERLFSPRNRLAVSYYSSGGIYDCTPALRERLSLIEQEFDVRVLYGRRAFGSATHEVLLIDPSTIKPERLSNFHYFVWLRFGLDSSRHITNHEFAANMAHAEPAFAALRVVLGESEIAGDYAPTILSHEFMGLPLWYAAELIAPGAFDSAFVAHEVASVRPLVEADDGHDTRFYNVLRAAQHSDVYLEDVFGPQLWNFKHDMLKTAAECNHVLAVGDLVVDELRFLGPRFRNKRIDLVYNGTPSKHYSLDAVQASAARLRDYAASLAGFSPTFVFSHATRLVTSKALWRDLHVLEQIDEQLAARGESAVLILLSSSRPEGRTAAQVRENEQHGWPREHRIGWPDLIDLEIPLYAAITAFNARARATRAVLINQFGFTRDRIGASFPEGLTFDDLRRGTDLEFGQSIYEPFGIAQVEPLSTGALCVISDVCGCLGFISRALGHDASDGWEVRVRRIEESLPNLIVTHYTDLPADLAVQGWRMAMYLGQNERESIERSEAQRAAGVICERLPRTPEARQALLDSGYALAQRMSWDVVAGTQLLPALGIRPHNTAPGRTWP
ncbi:MAG: hypothetical protein NTZ50_01240 [Chloroflexi bacterium]|nr:hypothetical protein [Chloroflexota bacterium]